MLMYTFVQNTKILAAPGSIAALGEMVTTAGYKKALLVHGSNIAKNGIADKVKAILAAAGVEYSSFEKVEPDPPADIVDEGGRFVRASGCDCVIAIGGGSAIDMAKCINILRFNEGNILQYASAPYSPASGLIAIPTTAGTGSELSTAAVVTDKENSAKVVVPTAVPDYAIIDPELTVSMPAKLTMYTGLDAFSHAAEGYFTLMSNIMMDPICEKVMEMIVESLPVAIKDGSNIEARTKMLVASSISGWTLTNVAANVGHSLAHVVGANLHLVHGAACAYGLPAVLKHVSPLYPQKVKRIGEILGASFTGNESSEEIGKKTASAYIAFRSSLGLKPIAEENLVIENIDDLADKVVVEPLAFLTPVPVDHDVAVKLLKDMLDIR